MNQQICEDRGKLRASIIAIGEKIHVITRRLFKEDVRRHFAGSVTATSGPLIRVEGYSFIFNPVTLDYVFRPEFRTRVFGIGDSNEIINIIPKNSIIERLRYELLDGRLVVTDGTAVSLDINEYNASS